MILSFVRHGEPARGVAEKHATDPPLSPEGRRQVESARALVTVDGYETVYCSPLRRARESAEILVPGVDLCVDDDLAEFDRHASAYLHWEDGADAYRSYLAGDLTPWGTTLAEFRGRIEQVVERMRVAARRGPVLAVTHGGVVNNFFAMLLGSNRTAMFQPGYGSVNRFMHHPEEGWTPLELNASVDGPATSPLQ